MAKQGPIEQAEYNPFNAISESLSDLSAPAAVQPPPKAAPAPIKKRDIPPPPKPVVVEPPAPQPQAPPTENLPQASSSGGAGQARPVAAPKTVSATSALQTTKRFKTSKQEGLELDAAAVKLGAALGVSVDFSKVTRALWDVYLRHQEDILRNVPEGELWERPANNDAAGLAELDQRLADLINEGLMVACRRPQNSR